MGSFDGAINTLEKVTLRGIATWGRPTPRQWFSALSQSSNRSTYPLLSCSGVFSADTLHYAVTLTFDPVTLTCDQLNLDPLWRGRTLYEIWAKSNNARFCGGVIAISIVDLMTLNTLCYVLG